MCVCVYITESFCCTVEIDTTLQSVILQLKKEWVLGSREHFYKSLKRQKSSGFSFANPDLIVGLIVILSPSASAIWLP